MSSVGPVPMPVVLILIFLLLAMAIARIWSRGEPGQVRPPAAGMVLDMLLVGLLCGRLSFVAAHFSLYREAPWSVLQIADGGYHLPVVVGAGFAWALWRLRRQRPLRAPVLAGALVGLLLWGGASQGLAYWQAKQMPLPTLQVVDLQGRAIDLQTFHGKPLVLNLWASWCGPCRREMPVLATAQQKHADIQFVFLNQGETLGEVETFLAAEHLSLGNVLLDEASAASTTLDVRAFPSTLFFDAQGRLQELHLGELTQAGLEHKLRRLR
ncbi:MULTISPECIES: TlpA disulfide reductase family protein [Stenotrophomonas]|uniref:TlpA family protein disulfide reductase n=1 Tax=Stenotrophomonas lactitubi TaxID=2045214 RepID=A0AAW4GP50_9GAMM|nr:MULTISPECIES: TlpA disulfide reductase family protein [Stenotrophomonas]MBM9915900.1 TlpA family protein disulfide reductase [Stenotrophomonas lactitubi]MBM9921125.1 TlpA family protein disulfide reductase [Stenotrophomonas lactitubi]MBM9940506.1 TlpA family protein disulfide reductase [Stenotrophomonas lactitubi]